MRNKYYHYYVEGEDDRKLINTLKTDFQIIESGKVEKFNVVQKELNKNHLRVIRKGTIVVLVFDTDTKNAEVLKRNVEFLKGQSNISDVVCIPQVQNLEEELVKSCSIKKVSEITKSKSEHEFKSDILRMNNLKSRLEECEFDFRKFWASKPSGVFGDISNDSNRIRK